MRGEYLVSDAELLECLELPPRARRIPNGGIVGYARGGNYLRVRGEYLLYSRFKRSIRELPPRARRILGTVFPVPYIFGTTSACAENTACSRNLAANIRNYLRVRGEYVIITVTGWKNQELPPRARRILNADDGTENEDGTTSACAENTRHRLIQQPQVRNYLRVRGEYGYWHDLVYKKQELPPRARRILTTPDSKLGGYGTTSACAENTGARLGLLTCGRNYLRVRGEYLGGVGGVVCGFGTTSACAENTLADRKVAGWKRNYLRVRGEYG